MEKFTHQSPSFIHGGLVPRDVNSLMLLLFCTNAERLWRCLGKKLGKRYRGGQLEVIGVQ
jgi:hypothetical protein